MFVDRPRGSAANGIIPVGGIIMWSGTVATIPTNWQLCDGTNGTPDLRDRFIVGATSDNGGVAKTNITGSLTQSGGSISYTPAGTNSAPTFTGSALGNHTHSVTSNVTVADHAAHVHSGSADHSNHTHTGPSHQHNLSGGAATTHTHDYTGIVNHTHTIVDVRGGSTGSATTNSSGLTAGQDTSSTAVNIPVPNPSGGVATATTAANAAGATDNAGTGASGNESAALSHGNTGNPTATLTHNPTNNAVTSGNESATLTPAGSVSAPTFTGTGASIIPPYFALCFIQRLS